MNEIEMWERKITNITDTFEFLYSVQKSYYHLKEAFSLVQDAHYVLNTIQGPFRNYETEYLELIE